MAAAGLVPAGPRLAAWPAVVAPRGQAPWRRESRDRSDLAVNHRSTGTSPVVSTFQRDCARPYSIPPRHDHSPHRRHLRVVSPLLRPAASLTEGHALWRGRG